MVAEIKSTLSLKAKLMVLVGISFIGLTSIAAYSTYTVVQMSNTISFLGNERIPIATTLGDLRADINAVARFMWLALAQKPGSENRSKSIKLATEALARLPKSIEALSQYQLTDQARNQVADINVLLPKLKPTILGATSLLEVGDDISAKSRLVAEMPPIAVPLTEKIAALASLVSARNKNIISESEKDAHHTKLVLIITSLLLGTGIVGFSFIFASKLSCTLCNISKLIQESSRQVAASAQQVSLASHQLSSASADQASAVEETSSSLEEISSMVKRTAENSSQSAVSGKECLKVTTRSQKLVTDLTQAVEAINTGNNDILKQIDISNQKFEEVVKIISEIGDKTKVINDIVFQTKLLSFNASVEAARAGEYGKGFAVVAEEVGNLAQMSGNASKEISEMLRNSISRVNGIASDIKSNVENLISNNRGRVENGKLLAKQCGEELKEVVNNVVSVNTMIAEISDAMQEQSQGITEINVALSNINKVTQETAATSENSASAGEDLNAQAYHLDKLVVDLSRIVTGHSKTEDHNNATREVNRSEHLKPIDNVINIGKYKPTKTHKTLIECDLNIGETSKSKSS